MIGILQNEKAPLFESANEKLINGPYLSAGYGCYVDVKEFQRWIKYFGN